MHRKNMNKIHVDQDAYDALSEVEFHLRDRIKGGVGTKDELLADGVALGRLQKVLERVELLPEPTWLARPFRGPEFTPDGAA